MKKVVAAVIALVIIAAGLPALLGVMAQNRINSLAETASSDFLFRVTVTGYQRGWASSLATLNVALSERNKAMFSEGFPGSGAPDFYEDFKDLIDAELQMVIEIVHGPLLTRGGVGLGLADVMARVDPAMDGLDELKSMLGMTGPGEFQVRVGIGTNSTFRLALPALSFTGSEGTIASSDLITEGTYDVVQNHQVVHSTMDRLEFTRRGTAITMEDMFQSVDSTAVGAGIWLGTSETGIGSLSISNPENAPVLRLDNLNFRTRNAEDESGDRINTTSELDAGSVEIALDGEPQSMADISMDLAMRNVDLSALTAYIGVLLDVTGTNAAATDPAALLAELQPIVHELLAAELEIELGPLGFQWDGGDLLGRIMVGIDNEMLPAEPGFVLMDPGIWSRLVNVEVELDVDRNVAELIAAQMLKSQRAAPAGIPGDVPVDVLQEQARGALILLVAQGMLEQTETGYRFRGSYENGLVDVNGRTLPLGAAAQAIF